MKHKRHGAPSDSFRTILAKIKEHCLEDKRPVTDRMHTLRQRARQGAQLLELLPEAYACVYLAVCDTLGVIPHDAQLLCALAMADGSIAELPTGEGKTLAAVFTASLAALFGEGVHILTFNDYLSRRDALWMKPVYERLGLTVAFIQGGMTPTQRKMAYLADITYLTAKEAGFDYLRGFLAFDPLELIQRPFYWAIVDEADSIMIDEARIPLVIAGDMPSNVRIDRRLNRAVAALRAETHCAIDGYANTVSLTEAGAAYLEQALGVENLYAAEENNLLTEINLLLQAHFLLRRDSDYIVRDGRVLPVDEFTGRVIQDREWPEGLQAAVECKEGLKPGKHGIVMNRITLRDFLGFYPHLCGMTGTVGTAATEFGKFYGLRVAVIPPDCPCIRIDRPDMIFLDKRKKYEAIASEIRNAHATGRSVLVGTRTVAESESLASLLSDVPGISVLNAKNDEEEAKIIARAGRTGAVTISTNMAGRGVDIRLGAGDEADYRHVLGLGGLYVIGANRHESERIDNQLRGRAGRQGDPGESRFFISLQDDLMVKYRLTDSLPRKTRSMAGPNPLRNAALRSIIAHTQRVCEGQALAAKITLAKYYSVAEAQRRIIYQKRMAILTGRESLSVLEKQAPEKLKEILLLISPEEYMRARQAIELFALNCCFADYLMEIDSALDEVPMISQMRQDPFYTFNRKMIYAFGMLGQVIVETVRALFDEIIIQGGKVDLLSMGVQGPSSTRTYLVSDGTESAGMQVSPAVAGFVNLPLYFVYLCAELLHRSGKK